MARTKTFSTNYPFKDSVSAKNLLSQWVLEYIFAGKKTLEQKEKLLKDSLEYILSDVQFKKLKSEDFNRAELEKLFHQK